jgi:integrase/recombinase XerD
MIKLNRLWVAICDAIRAARQAFEAAYYQKSVFVDNSILDKSNLVEVQKDLVLLEAAPAPVSGPSPPIAPTTPITAIPPIPPIPNDSAFWQLQGFWAHLESFLSTQNSVHTQRAYENDLVDFLSYLKATDKPMNVHTLVGYRDVLRSRVSERTGKALSHVSINRKIATIRSFLNWLVLNSVIPNNPAKAVKSFRAGRESPTRDIPNDMVARMLSLPSRHKIAGRMHHAMMSMLFHLGLRRAELVGLRTSDLFEQEGMRVIRVRGKGDKERVLPLMPDVAKSIDTYLEISRKDIKVDQPLFSPVKNNVTHTKEKALHPNAVAYVVKHYAKLAGINYRVSPHSARATAVSNALDNLAPHRAVQHMAGWSSPLMVTRYDKRKQELRNSAARYVNYDDPADDRATETKDLRNVATPATKLS